METGTSRFDAFVVQPVQSLLNQVMTFLPTVAAAIVLFLVGWMVIFAGVIGASAVALGFAGYFAALFGTPLVLVAMLLVVLMSLVIFWGIRQSARLAVAFTPDVTALSAIEFT